MRLALSLLVLALPILPASLLAQERELINRFWFAPDAQARGNAAAELLDATPVDVLYRRIKAGPDFPDDAPRGILRELRVGEDGTEYPYVVLVPDSYEPDQSYPVEFLLHGGVGRDKPGDGDTLWRGGYDSVRREDRIVVIPAGWREAYWWQDAQADNLPAILRELKRVYNIDSNRVSLTGVSDGGTGSFFYAFKQPSQWASFFAYIGHPGVLRSAASGGGYRLYFENLIGNPLYIVNGEEDPLYPAASLASFIAILAEAGITHEFRIIPEGGHNTQWLPQERPRIEAFRADHPRDPFPDSLQWVADRVDRYNRKHWIVIDELEVAGRPSLLRASRTGNTIQVTTRGVAQFTLLLNPEEVDFSNPLLISVNGRVMHAGPISQSGEVLLDWAGRELDRNQLVTAAVSFEVVDL